jgi:hypothetical protein
MEALFVSRDQTEVCLLFEEHEGGPRDVEKACEKLGVSKADWEYAKSEGGFYRMVGLVAEKLRLPFISSSLCWFL